MPSLSGVHTNPFVEFLRTYGPVAAADSIWDEHVIAEAQRTGVEPLEVASPKLDDLLSNLSAADPVSVILTGTAGDGKTWHCRHVFVLLGGRSEDWEASGPLIEFPLGSRKLVIVKDLSQFYGRPELPALMARILPAIQGERTGEVFLIAANDGQLVRFWRHFAREHPAAKFVEERIRVLLKEDRSSDPSLQMRMYNLSRQSHDLIFGNVVDAINEHTDWAGCEGCALLESGTCPIRRNLAVLASTVDPGMRVHLSNLIKLAAYNDNHLPMRHVLMLAVNIILGVSDRATTLMRCLTAHAMVEEGETRSSNPYDNALGLNVPAGTHEQYRAFTVFEDMGIGKETNNAIDSILVEAHPRTFYDKLMGPDPVFGKESFERARLTYQRGELPDFLNFQASIEQQRRRLFFTMERGNPNPALDPWKLTLFSYGGEYLDFAEALTKNGSIDSVRPRLIVGLNRSYTGAMCDESQDVWFASPAANTQSRIGRVLDAQVPVGRNRRYTFYFEFMSDAMLANGRPRMAVRSMNGSVLASSAVTPLMFEYLLRVQAGSLPGSFSRQCLEELRQFRLRVVAALSEQLIIDIDDLGDLRIVSVGPDGTLREDAIELIGSP